MNKTAIKNFAVRARNRLIEDITQKSYELGISKSEVKGIETFEGGFKIKGLENSRTYKKYEEKQRRKLVDNIKQKGLNQVIEEVAYTWFNRLIALRFMEVNEYLPTGVRVLSSVEKGKIEPDIIKEALNVDLDIDRELVYKLIDKNDTEDLYKYLLVTQCNELGKIMPQVFEEISDYTELLLPDKLLGDGSVIRDLVESIEEEDYKDQVEIIGWLYQYYISEKKDEVFADLKKNKKITKENIPAATQLFTPKWIVKYMIENSLGRLWLESHPDEELKVNWEYYLDESEQDIEAQRQLDTFKNPNLNPEDIKVLDPSCGSGHILVYAFDVLYDIYLKANYSERDIPQLILEKNLYGLDIDDRAGQLAAFALMMKARSKSRRIFRKRIELNVCSIQESNGIPKEAIDYLVCLKDNELEKYIHKSDIESLIEIFHDAKEYGSILDVKKMDFESIEKRIEEIRDGKTVDLFEYQYREIILEKIPQLVKQARIISEKYDVVCTNPPYMGNSGMNSKLSNYLGKYYSNSKKDLFSVFIEKGFILTKKYGFNTMVTMQSWMFLSSFEKMRLYILQNKTITSLVHMNNMVMGIAFGTSATVFRNNYIHGYKGTYTYVDYNNITEQGIPNIFPNKNYRYNIISAEEFNKIPSSPIAYWVSDSVRKIFESKQYISDICEARRGLETGNNNRFLRLWFEVSKTKIGFNIPNTEIAKVSKLKWFPYNKGGVYRRWYGNNDLVVNFENDGSEVRETGVLNGYDRYFNAGITWTGLTSGLNSFKYCENGFLFDSNKGPMMFPSENEKYYILGYLNTKVVQEFLNILNPTLSVQNKDINNLPYLKDKIINKDIINLVRSNIELAQTDWNSFEISWGFAKHPFLIYNTELTLIEEVFNNWVKVTEYTFNKLKDNEEKLNDIFIKLYELQNEFTSSIEDKNIIIRKADIKRDIKSFISYAVGCMFGRYSLDEEGLNYAGGEFNIKKYKTFIPTKDNVLVIVDDDYFEDDIVNRFAEFVKTTFGEGTLEENLDYIAMTLGIKSGETSRQTIRRYFIKDFYKDHVQTYQNRPIYWLFDSGKQNGFKALIYMHRYDSSTVARVRTDYLHKLQRKYEAEVKRINILLESDLTPREKSVGIKKKENLIKQIQECLTYDPIIAHVANQKIEIDLDDGVKVNYDKFQGVEVPQGEGKKPLKADLLAKI